MRTHHWLLTVVASSQLCLVGTSHAQSAPQPGPATVELPQASPLITPRLDLRAPKITTVFSQATIDMALGQARDSRTIEEVEVEGRRDSIPQNTPDIWPGPFAVFWAMFNPSQSWRILLPLPPDKAVLYSGPPPSATDPYRPVMLGPAFGN